MMRLNGLSGVSAWHVYNKIVFNMMFLNEYRSDSLPIEAVEHIANVSDEEERSIVLRDMLDKHAKHVTAFDVVTRFKSANQSKQKAMLLEALTISELSEEDYARLLSVHTNKYGMSYSQTGDNTIGLDSIPPENLMPMIMETLTGCANLNCDLSMLNKDELGLSERGRLTIHEDASDILTHNIDADTQSVLALSIKKALSQWHKLKLNLSSRQK